VRNLYIFYGIAKFQIPFETHKCFGAVPVALAIMGGYGGLFFLYKIKSAISGGKVEEVVKAVSSSPVVATTGIPSVDTPEFDKYLETDAFYKMLESEEQLGKVVADMK
jgi:hypothetical protein